MISVSDNIKFSVSRSVCHGVWYSVRNPVNDNTSVYVRTPVIQLIRKPVHDLITILRSPIDQKLRKYDYNK